MPCNREGAIRIFVNRLTRHLDRDGRGAFQMSEGLRLKSGRGVSYLPPMFVGATYNPKELWGFGLDVVEIGVQRGSGEVRVEKKHPVLPFLVKADIFEFARPVHKFCVHPDSPDTLDAGKNLPLNAARRWDFLYWILPCREHISKLQSNPSRNNFFIWSKRRKPSGKWRSSDRFALPLDITYPSKTSST